MPADVMTEEFDDASFSYAAVPDEKRRGPCGSARGDNGSPRRRTPAAPCRPRRAVGRCERRARGLRGVHGSAGDDDLHRQERFSREPSALDRRGRGGAQPWDRSDAPGFGSHLQRRCIAREDARLVPDSLWEDHHPGDQRPGRSGDGVPHRAGPRRGRQSSFWRSFSRRRTPGAKSDRDGSATRSAAIGSRPIPTWESKFTSDERPINPLRVVAEIMAAVDPDETVITHDSGYPRDHLAPFYVSTGRGATSAGGTPPRLVPRSGWRSARSSRLRTRSS